MDEPVIVWEKEGGFNVGDVAKKIIEGGSVLTLDFKKKQAWVDKWVLEKQARQIPFKYGEALVNMGFVGMDSGNFETGERHYEFKLR